jgi:Fic family protein
MYFIYKHKDCPNFVWNNEALLRIERKQYYEILERTQKGNFDVTHWLLWFFNSIMND